MAKFFLSTKSLTAILLQLLAITGMHYGKFGSNCSGMAQHSSIAAASIADNLRLAAAGATDGQLISALQQVELWPLICQLPLGLETQLGERGLGLSGGQLQRLALAQLLLQDTKLWLLDEPTAHLDAATAYRLHQLIGQLSAGKTLIIISHQLHGLDWLDQVIRIPAPAVSHTEVDAADAHLGLQELGVGLQLGRQQERNVVDVSAFRKRFANALLLSK